MTTVMRDLLVVLPGIMGSSLRRNGRPVWEPSSGVLDAITTLRRDLEPFGLPAGIGDGHPGDGVEPVVLIDDLSIIPGLWTANIGYSRLLRFLHSRFELIEAPLDDPDRCANFLPVAYDWRLSNRYNARRLKTIVEPALEKWRSQDPQFADSKLVFVCHSMGGLVARWFVQCEGGAAITRKLITLGTPHRGALKALEQLVNGTRIAPLSRDLTAFARTLPSLHQLLPEYACIETPNGLAKLGEVDVPDLDDSMTEDAIAFREDLDAADWGDVEIVPFLGFRQPTVTTARLRDGRVIASDLIEGDDERGDGTVPRLSGTPSGMEEAPAVRGVAAQHTGLPSHQGLLDDLEFQLGAPRVRRRAGADVEVAMRVEDLVLAGEPLEVWGEAIGAPDLRLVVTCRDEAGRESGRATMRPAAGRMRGVVSDLPPGAHHVTVGGVDDASPLSPVTATILVWSEGGS